MQYGVSGTPGSNNFMNTSYSRSIIGRNGALQYKKSDLRNKYSVQGQQQEMWNRMKQMGYNPQEVMQAINYAQAMKPAMEQQVHQQSISNIFGGLQSIVQNVPDLFSGIKGLFGK